MNTKNPATTPNSFISQASLLRILILTALAALVLVPLFAVSSASSALFSTNGSTNQLGDASNKASADSSRLMTDLKLTSRGFNFASPAIAETIGTYASDCTTPKTVFFLGEQVCAKTDGVTITDQFINWIQPPNSVAVAGGAITTNPQDFLYTPTVTGEWKVTIATPSDSSTNPTYFSVLPTPQIATYSGDCTTPTSSFNLGDTVCVKLNGAPTNPDRVLRRIELINADGYAVDRKDVTQGNQSETFVLPTAGTETTDLGIDLDNRGSWRANLTDTADGSVRELARMIVRDPALQVADLQISKKIIDSSVAAAGTDVESFIWLFNGGPDAAANPSFSDITPSNTTFRSLVQTSGPTFNCVTPAVDSAGPSTCTGTSLANGGFAAFKITYRVGSGVGNGVDLESTATASSDTFERSEADNSSDASITSSNPTNPTCTLTCPDNMTVTATHSEDIEGVPTSGANVTFAAEPAGTCGTLASSTPSGSFFPLGSTPVTITSSDGGSCSFVVTVVSSGSPVTISCPASITTTAGAGCAATVNLGTPTTTGDNVTVTGTRSDGKPLTDPFTAGTTTVTWTATNASGSESCTQTVTVNDVTPPVVIAPAPSSVSADANCQAAIPDLVPTSSVSDNCACSSADESESCESQHDITIIQTPAAGTLVGLGTHQITLTADDGAGNIATANVSFTVNDTTAPTFNSVPASITTNTGAGASSCDVVLDPGTATAADNCGPVTVTRSPSGNTFPVGTTTITWTAKDGANNETTATQTVTVVDNTPPVVTPPAAIVQYLPLNSSATSMAVTYPAATATDNCGAPVNLAYSHASGSTFPVGATTVTVTATDTHGNTATATFTVTVLYNFTGFFSPVDNLPTLNTVNAGRAIPVKFSLSGNKGLSIFAANSPVSVAMNCDGSSEAEVEETLTAGSSSLSYDAASGKYHYVWKTESSWAGTCRQLRVTLNDGTTHSANFKFR